MRLSTPKIFLGVSIPKKKEEIPVGSLKWFVYQCDSGEKFAIWLDESNTEAVNGSVGDFTQNTEVKFSLPRNLKPRTAIYESSDGRVRRQIVCLTRQVLLDAPEEKKSIQDQYREITLHLRSTRGERIRLPYAPDTGLNDGDAD